MHKALSFLSSIYLLFCSALELCIIIDRSVGAPGHVKDAVVGMNAIYKHMLKLATAKILNPLLIPDGPHFYKVMQVYENEEDQDVTLTT